MREPEYIGSKSETFEQHNTGNKGSRFRRLQICRSLDPDGTSGPTGVTAQAIKNFSEDAIINYFHDQSYFNYQCTFNPLDKVIELYERLLQAEKEKNELLKGK